MNADRWMATYRTLNKSATLAPRKFIFIYLCLAASLQAFSIALLCISGREICETMDFHPFFRINPKFLPEAFAMKKREAMTLITPSPLLLISWTDY
jgi:hypothetical protein